jgi:hypothetical protein
MSAENTFAVVTLIAFVFCIPAALILEGGKIGAGLAAATATGCSRPPSANPPPSVCVGRRRGRG